jgi:hypothetical protein
LKNTGARWEIAVDGKPLSYRDQEAIAREAATYHKTKHPGAEVVLRDLETGAETVIKHPLDK